MSQEELAQRLGYNSPATISYYEGGERKISILDLRRIGDILGLPLSYFLEEDDVAETGFFWLPAAQEVRPTARRQLGAFLAFASKNGRKASNLPADMGSLRPGEAAERILKLADIVRPPVRPRQVAEYLGVPVYDWQFPDEISGVFVSQGGVFCIGVNEQHPHVRQRFTVAHELGHFVFSSDRDLFIDFAEADTAVWDEEQKALETTANWFAADLLMPRTWIRQDVDAYGLDVTFLARRYEVSEQALWFRLLALKLA